jgi:quercetin 2,3-dioxygenase
MNQTIRLDLPETKMPYMIPDGEGQRYVFGTQVAYIIADHQSTGHELEIVKLTGGKGDGLPRHVHHKANEGIYVMDGKLELEIGTQTRLLAAGDYAHIPAGTVHALRFLGNRTKIVSVTFGGQVVPFYKKIGKPYEYYERPHVADQELTEESFALAAGTADIEFVYDQPAHAELLDNGTVPQSPVPYVLDAGEGDHTLSGNQVHSFLTTKAAAGADYIIVMSSGPKSQPIGEHYHRFTHECFMCVQGNMTLWADGEELNLNPGDFLFVPAGTKHRYALNSHYTKFMGVLSPGSFEQFFRTLGDPYEHPIFPSVPMPYRFDRVLANIHELDLVVTGKPPAQLRADE